MAKWTNGLNDLGSRCVIMENKTLEQIINEKIEETATKFGLSKDDVKIMYERFWHYYGFPCDFKAITWNEFESFVIGYWLAWEEMYRERLKNVEEACNEFGAAIKSLGLNWYYQFKVDRTLNFFVICPQDKHDSEVTEALIDAEIEVGRKYDNFYMDWRYVTEDEIKQMIEEANKQNSKI